LITPQQRLKIRLANAKKNKESYSKYNGGLTMKKVLIAAALVSVLGLSGLQAATAGPGWGPGDNSCRECGMGGRFESEANYKAIEKFREETVALRKTLAVKRGEYRALMHKDNPDEKRAAALSGELFDLRNELQQKAAERGIFSGFGHREFGCNMMADDDDDNKDSGRGRHRGGHMRD
jgi:zinc resistance-associated protein